MSSPVSSADAGSAPVLDAGAAPVDASIGLDSLVAAFFTEYSRQVDVTCPCRVEQQLFPSVQDCQRRFGNPISWIDCAAHSLAPFDGPELRQVLRCNVELYQKVSSCLEQHGCAPEEMNPCFDQPEQCPAWNGEAFTPVFYNCVDLTMVGR
jgi:hypothetical protein